MVSSTESAITSREGSDDFMPSCPMAMPSVTVMVQNSRGVLGTLGHVPAGQLRFEVCLRVHHAFRPALLERAPNGRGPEVVGSTSQRRVWPNRGAAEPDSHSEVNVLAVLRARNTINDWLIKNVTPWPHEGLAFAKDRRRVPASHAARNRGSKPSSARALAIETAPSSSAML